MDFSQFYIFLAISYMKAVHPIGFQLPAPVTVVPLMPTNVFLKVTIQNSSVIT